MAASNRQKEATDALRAAVDGAVQATVGQASASRERAQELVDEVAQAAGRMRDVLDDLRLATREDIRDISDRLGSLERRLSALEAQAPAKAKPAAKKAKPAARK